MAIKSEGLLISPEILQKVSAGEIEGQKPADFVLDGKVRLSDEMTACWSAALDYWHAFQRSYGRLKEGDTGATPTREQWILPLLRFLGFGQLSYSKSAAQVGGQTYFISHRDGSDDGGLPVHIEGANTDLDTRPPSGTPRISPQALVQEYLNRTEQLWGIVTNGLQFRLLRDSTRMSRPTYLEFDLEHIMEGNHFAEFQLFYRLVHRSRWPQTLETASSSLLEHYYLQSIEEGGRVRERLRDGVEEALKILGNGFLRQPENTALKDKITRGELSAGDYYSQLLRLVYRFLFLMVAEDRRLAGPDPSDVRLHRIYSDHYSVSRIRRRVERHFNPQDRYSDAWEAMRQTFAFYRSPSAAEKLGMAALDGGLFDNTAMPDLENARLYNRDFLRALRHLSLFEDNRMMRPINYGGLDVEELGSVYESLLDFHPHVRERGDTQEFDLVAGGERKTTGSYYTRPELVQELIKSALEPVMQQRLMGTRTREDKEKALLSIRVCDPASGSGHFLLAAARRIGTELARVRTGEEHPPPTQVRLAVRDVIRHCIYGVDINPLATDLCRVALWLEGHYRGLPLAFLDHRIKTGNSLVGVDTIERLKQGIPDDAFKPVAGDVKDAARKIKEQNRRERERLKTGQMLLTPDALGRLDANLETFAADLESLRDLDEDAVDDVQRKQELFLTLHAGEAWLRDWTACHIWTAAFYSPLLDPDDAATPTQGKLMQYMNNPGASDGRLLGQATALAYRHRFFHWPLEFPEVARTRGFDVVLSNPPFGNAIEDKTARDEHESKYFGHAIGTVAKGAYDRANLFFGKALGLLREQGAYGIICPRATASGKSSEPLRQLVSHEGPLRVLWCPDNSRLFGGASVFVCLAAGIKGAPPLTIRVSTSGDPNDIDFVEVAPLPDSKHSTWWELLQGGYNTIGDVSPQTSTLSDVASIWAGCITSVAYELAKQVSDESQSSAPKLVTTGAIDRFKCRWGTRRIRYLKRDYQHPRWPRQAASKGVAAARDRQTRHKILVAGLSRVIEAVLDSRGDLAGVVSTHVIVPTVDQHWALLRLAAVLNSAFFSFTYLERFGAKQMSGGNCTIGKGELLSMPIPHDMPELSPAGVLDEQWRELVALGERDRAKIWGLVESLSEWLATNDESDSWIEVDVQLHALISALYGLSPQEHMVVLDWWQKRRT